ncbi:Holliday junction branch migration protein RuvA [Nocardioides sp. Kera G14]|uniref:Holliday junction branch migration protein RuvA n=1 Tax=Nocardioides sp. Kera G14 TaxID=2884264 RepID=UPI001D10D2DC|nr:Holliday junction branch migration protein RuvA [Nocardioides sp. Kera G14]UDY22181.1 Holliday junction branch migration protein RuvA [Nocardioides sp. Kera G14]
MISHVRGTVAAVTLSSAVIEVGGAQGGVGLELLCTPSTLAGLRTGTQAALPSALIVREDSLTLFGFANEEEKSIFEIVQTVQGVGPKLAQAIVAVLEPDTLRMAVASDDAKTLTKVPGVGLKGAQRMILELKDRLGAPTGTSGSTSSIASAAPWRTQVAEALTGLGYNAKDADRAVQAVEDPAGAPNVSQLLKAALQILSKA